ncbi:MAG: YncE family protein [Terriglobales bacterium]
MKRLPVLILTILIVVFITSCGGNGGNSATPASKVQHRAFISNTFAGNLQIMDAQNDTTPLTAQTYNSFGQLVPGVPVTITVGGSLTFAVESPSRATTLVYSQSGNVLDFVDNATETVTGSVVLPDFADMALFSTDGTKVYAPVRNVPVTGKRPGAVEVITLSSFTITGSYPVPSARYIALSPSGQFLLVFADDSDSVFLIDLSATTPSPVEIPGFARPVNAFFSSDSNTAYVLSCGVECGSTSGASVQQLDIPSKTIKATVPVGGASVGLLNSGTLYVAGNPGPAGTYDAVTVSTMTRVTANSVAIGDGYHSTMALATNNKLYIGAKTCLNLTTGCLSVVDVSNNTADAPLPPKGAVTGMLAIANRNTVYVIEGGYLTIYDTTTDAPQKTQVVFTGALYGVVQVDQ